MLKCSLEDFFCLVYDQNFLRKQKFQGDDW